MWQNYICKWGAPNISQRLFEHFPNLAVPGTVTVELLLSGIGGNFNLCVFPLSELAVSKLGVSNLCVCSVFLLQEEVARKISWHRQFLTLSMTTVIEQSR